MMNEAISGRLRAFLGFILFVSIQFAHQSVTHAFNVNTHVYIAQEVINDVVDDGSVTFVLTDGQAISIGIPIDLTEAIRANRSVYRMGHLGPDALPDVYTGQFAVHPGTDPHKYSTDEWLQFLLNSDQSDPKVKSFIYGYMGHAAADIFAHTYVNHYSGNIFDVLSEMSSMSFKDAFVEEERHIELEKYIAEYNPPITDNNGNDLGEAYQLIETPAEFVRDRLVLNGEVSHMNKTNGATHLYLVHKLHDRLGTLDDEFEEMDIIAMQIAWYFTCTYFTGGGGGNETPIIDMDVIADLNEVVDLGVVGEYLDGDCLISRSQAQRLAELDRKIQRYVNQYSGIDELQSIVSDLVGYSNQFTQLSNEVVAEMENAALDVLVKHDELTGLNAQAATLNALIQEKNQTLDSMRQQLQSLNNSLSGMNEEICENQVTGIGWSCGWFGCHPYDIVELVCRTNQVFIDVNNQMILLDQAIHDLESEIASDVALLAHLTGELIPSATLALDEAVQVRQAVAEFVATEVSLANGIALDFVNGALDTMQRFAVENNAIRALVHGWRTDIEDGLREYMHANTKMWKSIMMNEGGTAAFAHIKEWWNCWGLALAGLPSTVTTNACSIDNKIQEMLEALDDLETALVDIDPVSREIHRLKTIIEEEIREYAEELALKFVEEATGVDVQHIIDVISAPASDQRLNSVFGVDSSAGRFKGLLEIPDMANRVKHDMGAATNSEYNKNTFAIIRNAIVMSKLALLDADGLNQLAIAMGVSDSIYPDGAPLYPDADTVNINVLIGAARSIDGNHQWMEYAPPYPRRPDYIRPGYEIPLGTHDEINLAHIDADWLARRQYGYSTDNGAGFRLWTDCAARDLMFRRLFAGPLNPGIENPSYHGLSDVYLTSDYRFIYNANYANPFPDDVWNTLNYDYENNTCSNVQILVFENDIDLDGLSNDLEQQVGTNPQVADTDADSMSDRFEYANGLNPLDPSDAALDSDGDGLSNAIEAMYRTNPFMVDSDYDGLSDHAEIMVHLTNALSADTDGDGMTDSYELNVGFSPFTANGDDDIDGDGLTNSQEFLFGSSPFSADADQDGLSDALEQQYNTNPNRADTDGDGESDYAEIQAGTDPNYNPAAVMTALIIINSMLLQ